MKELTPKKSDGYTVNGHPINFRPADAAWAEGFMNMLTRLEERLKPSPEDIKALEESPLYVFQLASKQDAIIREELDSVLGEGACAAYYDGNMTTTDDDDIPYWVNFVLILMTEIGESAHAKQGKRNAAMDKYLAKFQKYQRK